MTKETIRGIDGPTGPSAKQSNNEIYEKTYDSYRSRICAHPKKKQEMALERLADSLKDEDLMDLETEFYRTQISKIREKMFKMYTGFAQCCGNLVIEDGMVLICCCEEMAEAVSFHGAHVHDEKLYICDGRSEVTLGKDETAYVIRETRPMSTEHCPFCGAEVVRMSVGGRPQFSEVE